MSSYGSHSVKLSREKMQQVGASARDRLIAAAAARWGVQPQNCTAANSIVTHTATGRTFGYGELAGDAAKITLAKEPAIKTPDQYTFIGKPMPRIDVAPKTNGSAKFAIDTQLPDMVFALQSTPARCRAASSGASMIRRERPRRASSRWCACRTRWRWSRREASGAPSKCSRSFIPNGT
jgi:CO/xanthine dehydrogenase Mo-binding subunit